MAPISAPKTWSISARVASVSSMVSWSRAHGDGRVIDLEVGEDRGDFERMVEIGVAGGALLLAMLLHGIDIGLVEQIPRPRQDCRPAPSRRVRTGASSGAALRRGKQERRPKSPGASIAIGRVPIRSIVAALGRGRLSMPRSSSSSDRVSKVSPSGSASASSSGAACFSGSSTSTYFCSEWIRSSPQILGRNGAVADFAQRNHGFLSLSRSTVIAAPAEIMRAR